MPISDMRVARVPSVPPARKPGADNRCSTLVWRPAGGIPQVIESLSLQSVPDSMEMTSCRRVLQRVKDPPEPDL